MVSTDALLEEFGRYAISRGVCFYVDNSAGAMRPEFSFEYEDVIVHFGIPDNVTPDVLKDFLYDLMRSVILFRKTHIESREMELRCKF